MNIDKIDGIWDNYIEKTKSYDIPNKSIRWYVKRAEEYIQNHSSVCLAEHTQHTVEAYFRRISSSSRLSDWQFHQVVESVKILFLEIVQPQWAETFPWEFWMDSATQLLESHATIARDYQRRQHVG